MNALAQLKKDHLAFRGILNEMEAILQVQGPTSSKELASCVRRLMPGLLAHEKAEEKIFAAFPQNSKSDGPSIFDILSSSHEQLHSKLEALNEALSVSEARLSQIVAGMDFVTMFRDHMEEEEEVFFPFVGPQE